MIRTVEAILGVRAGETPRYVEAVDAANDLVNAIADGTIVAGVTSDPIERDQPEEGRIQNTVATGYAVDVQGRNSEYTAAAVFESQRDVRLQDVEAWVNDHSAMGRAMERIRVEQGRVGFVTGGIPTRDLWRPRGGPDYGL